MRSTVLGLFIALFLLLVPSAALATTPGPDIIVSSLYQTSHYTSGGAIDGIRAYAIGTISCNIGDAEVQWYASSNQHPVIVMNMFRYHGGRFEQIGISWVKHGFCAVDGNDCGLGCQTNGTCNRLGVGCSDPYSASLNGQQSNMGPRSDVNPVTGQFNYPFPTQGQGGNAIYKRLQVYEVDLNPALYPGALYYVDSHYVSPDEPAWGNDLNNMSYRRVTVSGSYGLTLVDTTRRELPAIFAWQENDPQVNLAAVDVPGDGRFWLGARATDNGNGTWRYEYAIHNVNSARCVGSVSVPIGSGITVGYVGFHDTFFHSGEPYDNTDWNWSVSGSAVAWNSPQTFQQNKYTNALRWGTLYNYRFDVDAPPTTGTITLGLFVPGTPASVTATTVVPTIPICACPGDVNGNGVLDGDDIGPFVAMYLGAQPLDPCADVALPLGGPLDASDLAAFVDLLVTAAACP
jgi:hypothetical protein